MAETVEKAGRTPPGPRWRYVGLVYLLFFLAATGGVLLMKGLVVSADPAATVNNVRAHEALYRSGIAAALVSNGLYLALVALFYRLFEVVSRVTSLVAAFFGLMGCAIQTAGDVFQTLPLLALRGGAGVQAMIPVFLELRAQFLTAALVFFAVYCLLVGYLVFRSEFLPRILGLYLMAAGVAWLTYLWPPLAGALSRFVQPFGGLAELALMLWLLFKGVDATKWQEKASQ